MRWFWQRHIDDRTEMDTASDKLVAARSKRREAVQRLIQALDEVKLDDGLVKVGCDILKPEKRSE